MAAPMLRRAGVGLLWYVLPALAVLGVAAYVTGALVWHANPPAVPVTGVSMRPTLERGDLVFLKGVDPSKLRKGDVIAFHVPKDSQSQYGLPGELVHRIIKIQPSPGGLIFHTKGDANSGPDVFVIHGSDVVGEMVGKAPGLGFPLLFFRSRQGEILLGAAVLVALIYFLIGVYEERRVYVEGTALGMQTVLAETQELRQLLAAARDESAAPTVVAPSADVRRGLGELEEEVRRVRERGEESTETIRQLVGAVGEYGLHLRSHTAVMQNLASTTAALERATAGFSSALSEPGIRRGAMVQPVERERRAPIGPSLARVELGSPAALPLGLPVELLLQREELRLQGRRVDELLSRVLVGSDTRELGIHSPS